ncbi:N-acetyltransferase, partial [Salmonella enterica subsp. enterica serovar Anatum]|nr:N-acetyltransferase [Salmonella enterica subsp. enterica serovar Anatum]
MDNLTIEILADNAEYNWRQFDCGEVSLNLFLTQHLQRQHN